MTSRKHSNLLILNTYSSDNSRRIGDGYNIPKFKIKSYAISSQKTPLLENIINWFHKQVEIDVKFISTLHLLKFWRFSTIIRVKRGIKLKPSYQNNVSKRLEEDSTIFSRLQSIVIGENSLQISMDHINHRKWKILNIAYWYLWH